MAHFSKLDENNEVIETVVVDNQWILDSDGNESEQVGINFLKSIYGDDHRWVQTSYNGSFRGSFGGRGSKYDEDNDIFYSLNKQFESWILNTTTGKWEAPLPPPDGYSADDNAIGWNEELLDWEIMPPPPEVSES